MLGVEGYGSDDDSDHEVTQHSNSSTVSTPGPSQPSKSDLTLPLPAKGSTSKGAGSGLSLPPPKSKAGHKKKKITIGLPSLEDDEEDNVDDKPAAKKPRLDNGARKSSLLSMLPAPKQSMPLPPPKERVLGGGQGPGLVFKTSHPVVESTDDDAEDDAAAGSSSSKPATSSVSFLPPSLQKGKANISTEGPPRTIPKVLSNPAPAVDFFSSSRLATSSPAPSGSGSSPSALPKIPTGISAAPKVDDFIPPEPTPQDPYPGYYQTPTGQWAAYDPGYYKKFYDKWKTDYDKHVRALEKGRVKGFEAFQEDQAEEVDTQAEMERAKREEKKKLTQGAEGAPVAPKMNIKACTRFSTLLFMALILLFRQGAALGGRARSRHQLSTLLTEAYTNREALEERIAQGRRNRKEAGMKYGTWTSVIDMNKQLTIALNKGF
ncbi:hypothetical protein OE88DRAFT_1622859 [Heliocybe sulcata]|uniref:Mitotic checkpoint regulator, MAD2B-interacting-domain-containing protein n=1 Tax=Heliocybe sulcata TaxID=5364 RepID=A0A5C3NF06_9AGAM|nr:hypothetical protein OE88DRAFT_1622859 [Heliocybe sulcata]